MIFADEFNGTTLDLTTWSPTWFHGNSGISPRVNGAETGDYDSANVTVGAGQLTIAAQDRKCLNLPRCTGIITSNGKFQFTYGVSEWRAWLDGSGCTAYNWASTWQDGQSWPTDGEIDLMEVLGGRAAWHFHYPGGAPGGTPPGCYVGWHTFAADWEPGLITWYYDGLKVGTWSDGVTNAPMYLVANYALPNTVHLPSTMGIDYVRVWHKG
jgi:beta-glucanase (GH16 family)